MAVVAEELISDLIVRDGKLRSGIRSAQQAYGAGIGSMRNDTKRFESEFNRSSSNVSDGFKRMAGTLAAGVSLAATSQLIDSYTRLQNSLRVAGLEGEKLQSVQNDLLALSTRYGVNIEGLANLYGKAADAGRSFGASEAEVLKLTEATSQSLLITGTRAEQASGAILGLSQALASGTVRAEEFNQINEGGLRPLLQAAAATERFGGDVNKLRAAVLAGTVSSQEFFNAIMAGSAQLEGQASKATLTLSGAFESLNSNLTVYVGSAASASGVTGALASGIQALAANLDTIIPALATIAAAIGVRYVAGLTVAAARSVALSAASLGLAVSLNGVGAAARGAGVALMAAFGGPVVVALTALGAALIYAATQADDLSQASEAVRQSNQGVATGATQASSAIDKLASSYGRARQEARALVEEQLKLSGARLALAERDVLATGQRDRRAQESSLGSFLQYGQNAALVQRQIRDQAAADMRVAQQTVIQERQTNARLRAALNAPAAGAPAGAPPPAVGGRASGGRGGGNAGRDTDEINDRFAREILQYSQQILSARESLATTAEEEADIARRSLEASRRAALNELENNADYDEAQRDRLRQHIEQLAAEEEAIISRRETLRLSEEAADLAATEQGLQQEILQNTYRLAETQGERRRIALEMLDSDYRLRRAELDRIIATEGIAKALKDKAIAERAQLDQITQGRRDQINRDTENPLERLARESNRTAAQVTEDIQSIQADGLNALGDGITDVIMQTRSLGDVFKSVANQIIADLIRIAVQRAIIGPLANALFGGTGGGAASAIGSGASAFTGLFRAGGGSVSAGQLYRVNEGQQEFFRPATDGRVIPLSQQAQAARPASGAGAGPTIVQLAVAPGEMFVPIVEGISGNVSVRTVQAAAPGLVRAATIETTRRAGRPRT